MEFSGVFTLIHPWKPDVLENEFLQSLPRLDEALVIGQGPTCPGHTDVRSHLKGLAPERR